MEEKEKIIVFRQFDNAIDANIAKTKLDAYGVPCFLTEENMSNLYPGQMVLGMKVRLHLFADDAARAEHVLADINLSADGDTVRCPRCHSARIVRDFPKESSESLTVLFFGVLFPHKKVNRCTDCDNEF